MLIFGNVTGFVTDEKYTHKTTNSYFMYRLSLFGTHFLWVWIWKQWTWIKSCLGKYTCCQLLQQDQQYPRWQTPRQSGPPKAYWGCGAQKSPRGPACPFRSSSTAENASLAPVGQTHEKPSCAAIASYKGWISSHVGTVWKLVSTFHKFLIQSFIVVNPQLHSGWNMLYSWTKPKITNNVNLNHLFLSYT